MRKKALVGLFVAVVVVGGVIVHTGTEDNGMKVESVVSGVADIPDVEHNIPASSNGAGETLVADANQVVETETAAEEAYIQSLEDADIENTEVETLDKMMFASQAVNLRSGTAVTTDSLRVVGFNEEVKVTGITIDGKWYQVYDTNTESTGYIASSYLSDTRLEQNQSEIQVAQSETPDASADTINHDPANIGEVNSYEESQQAASAYEQTEAYAALSDNDKAALAQLDSLLPNKGPVVQTGQLQEHGHSAFQNVRIDQ